jgi:hypothetical protein
LHKQRAQLICTSPDYPSQSNLAVPQLISVGEHLSRAAANPRAGRSRRSQGDSASGDPPEHQEFPALGGKKLTEQEREDHQHLLSSTLLLLLHHHFSSSVHAPTFVIRHHFRFDALHRFYSTTPVYDHFHTSHTIHLIIPYGHCRFSFISQSKPKTLVLAQLLKFSRGFCDAAPSTRRAQGSSDPLR